MLHYSHTTAIEQIARTIDAGNFDDHIQPQPYQRLAAASLGGFAVLIVAATLLATL